MKKRVIIDTDVGMGILGSDIDDGLALIFALRSPELKVEAITTVTGNVDVEEATICALNILELMGIENIPVGVGANKPLLGNVNDIREAYNHALAKTGIQISRPRPSGLKPVSLHAIDLIISKVMQYPGEITLIAIGPLTNIALAIVKEPQIIKYVKELIIMGGAATVLPYCVTSVAEFNMYIDPEAAEIVFSSGMPTILVGFDVTMKVFLQRSHLNILKSSNSPLMNFVEEQVENWLTFLQCLFPRRVEEFRDGCPLHDPLAVAIAVRRDLVETEEMKVDIETKGELTRGQLVADRGLAIFSSTNPHSIKVCTKVDVQGFMGLLLDTLMKQ